MRLLHLLPLTLLGTLTAAIQLPTLRPFISAFPISIDDYILRTVPNDTASANYYNTQTDAQQQRHHQDDEQRQAKINQQHQHSPTHPLPDLKKRADGCPGGFDSCSNLGAPNLCCASNAVCSADYAGDVACCPSGAQCSGVVQGTITSGTVNPSGIAVTSGSGSVSSVGSSSGLVTTTAATVTSSYVTPVVGTNGGSSAVVVVGTSVVASPGAAVRGVDLPWIARAIVDVLGYVPL